MKFNHKLILSFFLLLTFIVFVVHFIWLPDFLDKEVSGRKELESEHVEILAQALIPDLLNRDLAKIYLTLNRIKESQGHWDDIRIYDEKNRLLYPLEPGKTALNLFWIGSPIKNSTTDIGTIYLGINIKKIVAEKREGILHLEFLIFLILLFYSFISLILQYFWVILPLKKLGSATQIIAGGNDNITLPRDTNDEIGEFSRNFKAMHNKVLRREAELKEKHDELETLIQEKQKLIEEKTRSQQFAEEANSAKSTFLASMSHEIRTPLNIIIGMSELLTETPLSIEQEKYVKTFSRASETLLDLINDILDISKIEAGHIEIDNYEFDLIDLMESTAEVMSIKATAKGIDIYCDIAEDIPSSLIGDATKLRQVIVNLIGNAIKFTEKGEIIVKVEKEFISGRENFFRFSVTDTGIGIPQEKLESIFEGFTQADSSITRKFGGTGLGLTISKKFINMMGGDLWVESTVGQGSRFHFNAYFLPQKGAKKLPVPTLFEGLKILVLESSLTSRAILEKMFSSWGIITTIVDTVKDALEEVKKEVNISQPYKLFLVSCQEKEEPVCVVIKDYLEEFSKYNLPFMGISHNSKCLKSDLGRELGINCSLLKPFKRNEMLETIFKTLGNKEVSKDIPNLQIEEIKETVELKPIKILLVEDNIDNRLLVMLFLKNTPYQVEMAENGQLALDMFKLNQFDLVFMDMQMPVMDGLTATRLMREYEKSKLKKAIPIVALTANIFKQQIDECIAAGCTSYLAKPIKKKILLDFIRKTQES